MTLQELYYYKHTDYDSESYHKTKKGYCFIDFIRDCEKDFNKKYQPYFANILAANTQTLCLLKTSMNGEPHDFFGMESTDGDADIEMNLKIDDYSKSRTVYAIGCDEREDEPLFLIIDNNCSNNQVIFKYIPDDDEEDNCSPTPTWLFKEKTA